MRDAELIKVINREWMRLYGGEPVTDAKLLALRIELIADDRDCWLANSKANQKQYIKCEKKLCAILEGIEKILHGIELSEMENEAGWWETSAGVKFGKERIEIIRALFTK